MVRLTVDRGAPVGALGIARGTGVRCKHCASIWVWRHCTSAMFQMMWPTSSRRGRLLKGSRCRRMSLRSSPASPPGPRTSRLCGVCATRTALAAPLRCRSSKPSARDADDRHRRFSDNPSTGGPGSRPTSTWIIAEASMTIIRVPRGRLGRPAPQWGRQSGPGCADPAQSARSWAGRRRGRAAQRHTPTARPLQQPPAP